MLFKEVFHEKNKEYRVEKYKFDDLRHVFATRLIQRGEGIITVKELLGHKTLAMVTRYGHVTLDDKRRAIMKLENGKE
jgi:integrase